MCAFYELNDTQIGNVENPVIQLNSQTYTFKYPCTSNVKCTPYILHLKKGFYKLEVWGASGGSSTWKGVFAQSGGKGGYSVGVYQTLSPIDLYVYIGGYGTNSTEIYQENPGGYNGGGQGGMDFSELGGNSGGGGGGTDVRLHYDNIYSRIIVAGGGASGSCNHENEEGLGPAGGGETGERFDGELNGAGGSQTQGGLANHMRNATDGKFFFGGNGSTLYTANGGGAGGGGYFGGGGGTDKGPGGGGSGYVIPTAKNLYLYPETGNGAGRS